MWYLSDQHGDTRALIDTVGTIQATWTYTAYGVPTRTSGTATTPLLYGGGYTDTDTGLIYLLNRYFDPGTGVFTTSDPALLITKDPYGYLGGDPLNDTDTTGLMPSILAGALIGAVIGAASGAFAYGLQYETGAPFSWRDFGSSVLGGTVSGGITGACIGSGVGLVVGAVCGAAAGAAGSWVSQKTDSTPGVCWQPVATDAVIGAVAGLGGPFFKQASGKSALSLREIVTLSPGTRGGRAMLVSLGSSAFVLGPAVAVMTLATRRDVG